MTVPLPAGATLDEAKDWLRANLDKGARCPCCTQHAQVYRWSLYGTAVKVLIGFYELRAIDTYVHSNTLRDRGHKAAGGAVTRLRWWNLLEEEKTTRPDGGRSGHWRLTQLGIDWLHSRLTVPKYAYVYDSRVLRFDGPGVSVGDVLKTPFDLRQLGAA